jgi:hypothetical protein
MIGIGLLAAACGGAPRQIVQPVPAPTPTTPPAATQVNTVPLLVDTITANEIAARVAQFAPATLDFDDRTLAPWEKQVLAKLVDASRVLHEIYTVQVAPQNPTWRAQLAAQNGAGKEAALQYFDIMVGPWDRLQHDEPFLEVGGKPAGAGYYPQDMTKQEFESFVAANPNQKDALTGYFTVITRDANKSWLLFPTPPITASRSSVPPRCCAKPPISRRTRR